KVKAVYKNRGDAVKNLEQVVQVHNPDWLRLEGLLEVQYRELLREGMDVVVEPTIHERHEKLLRGHLHEVTGVAVARNGAVVSGSEARTVRVWDRVKGEQKKVLPHPTAVKAVACTPAAAGANLCLSGAADGVGRVWDLDKGDAPLYELRDGHKGP